jgi:hypothetical protein
MVAKAAVRITERIPHKDVSYAYLELEAASVNEFQSLRDEALTSPALSHYAFAAKAPAVPTTGTVVASAAVETVLDEIGVPAADTTDEDAAAGASEAPTASAPQSEMSPAEKAKAKIMGAATAVVERANASTEGLSPREIAKQRMLAKKGA